VGRLYLLEYRPGSSTSATAALCLAAAAVPPPRAVNGGSGGRRAQENGFCVGFGVPPLGAAPPPLAANAAAVVPPSFTIFSEFVDLVGALHGIAAAVAGPRCNTTMPWYSAQSLYLPEPTRSETSTSIIEERYDNFCTSSIL